MAQIKQIEVNDVIYDITGGGGHEINDSEGVSLTQRDILQFGEGLLAEDDSVNEKTVVLPDAAPVEDILEIVSPLPSVMSRLPRYSTEEQMVGYWIDGKPVYQKTITGLNVNVPIGSVTTNWTNLAQIENIEMVINIACFTSSKQLISMNEVNISNNYVQVQGTFEARTIVTAILEYTKTTDTPAT